MSLDNKRFKTREGNIIILIYYKYSNMFDIIARARN